MYISIELSKLEADMAIVQSDLSYIALLWLSDRTDRSCKKKKRHIRWAQWLKAKMSEAKMTWADVYAGQYATFI